MADAGNGPKEPGSTSRQCHRCSAMRTTVHGERRLYPSAITKPCSECVKWKGGGPG